MSFRYLLFKSFQWLVVLSLIAAAVLIVFFAFVTSAYGQSIDNTLYVKSFQGRTVGEKVRSAQSACNHDTAIPCYIVFDPSLAKWQTGTIPAKCVQCVWKDYTGNYGGESFKSATLDRMTVGQTDITNSLFYQNDRYVAFGASASCYHFGDSITEGYYASSGNGYAPVFDRLMGWTCANRGVSGKQLSDIELTNAIFGTTVQQNTISTLLPGANDMRSTYCDTCAVGMSTAASQSQWLSELLSVSAWLALPTTAKTSAKSCPATPNNPSCVWNGVWADVPQAAWVRQTSAVGASVKVYVVGSAVYFSTLAQHGNTSTFTLTVDGVSFPSASGPTFNTAGVISRTFADPTRNWTEHLFRVGGLPNTQHEVIFTCTAADADNPCYFSWAGSNGASMSTSGTATQRLGPYLFLGTTLRAGSDGYTAFGGSDYIVGQFIGMVKEAANELASDGLQVQIVDTSSAMNPNNATLYHIDKFHPSTAGHATLAQVFKDAITALSLPNDRGIAQILQSVNPCTYHGALLIGGCNGGAFDRGDLGASQSRDFGQVFLGLDGKGVVRRNGNNLLLQAGTTTSVIQFGGITSQFPGLKLFGGGSPYLMARTADDSADAGIGGSTIQASKGVTSAAGMQHVRVTSCTTGAVQWSSCNTTINWPVAFADVNYTAVCSADSLNANGHISHVGAKANGSAVVALIADTAVATHGTISCIAFHD